MKTTLRWLAGVAAGVTVLALAVALVAAWWFDSDAFKAEIEARVKKETGLALSITGDLSLSLFPGLGVTVGHTALGNAPGFGGETMAEFESLSLRVKLKPLLGGIVAPHAVVVEGLKVQLVRDASGRHNYDALLPPADAGGRTPPALAALGGLTLVNAALTYNDETSGEMLRIGDLNFHTGPLSARRPAPVAAQFQFSQPARSVEGDASIEAELSMDEALRMYSLQPAALVVALRGPETSGGGLQLRSEGGLRYDAAARRLTLENLELATSDAGIIDGPIRLRIPRAAVDLVTRTVSVERFAVSALQLDLHGDLALSAAGTRPAFKGNIRVAHFKPRELLARLGRPPAGTDADRWPSEARLETAVSGDTQSVTLDPFALTLDGVQIAGRIDLGFTPERPLTLALRMNGLSGARDDPLELTLRGSGHAPEGASTYQASDLELKLGPLIARGKAQIDASEDAPRVSASLELPTFDARALLGHLGMPVPETRDPEALTRLAVRAEVAGSRGDLALDPLALELDETRITGSLSVSKLWSPSPALSFALRADALDTRRYLPFTLPGSEQGIAVPSSLAALQSLDLNGRLRLGALVVGDVVIDDVEVVARSRNGRLELQSGSRLPRSSSSGPITASDSLTLPAP